MYKKLTLIFLLFTGISAYSQEEINFQDYFVYKTLRFDFNFGGDRTSETIFPVMIKQEPFWGGPMKHLIDPMNYGTYRVVVLDSASNKIIYSRGFSNLFQEWQSTPEAGSIQKAYYQVVVCPFPKKSVILKIEKRGFETGIFNTLFISNINPSDYFINLESPQFFPSVKFKDSGNPIEKVDVAFIADGYTMKEMDKFRQDAKKCGEELLSIKPYSDYSDRFNFYAIETVSQESGADIPADGIYFNTALNSSFYTFNSERYLTTSDIKTVYDAAANTPYDAIIILVNHKKYGGGGFYNLYALSSVDNEFSIPVMIHEFGHSFAGLADEYVGSVNFSDYYNLNVEPWEPNITTNVDFKGKWKDLIDEGTPVPTPRSPEFAKTTGMFEGGGYMSKGIYSPMMDCRMKTNKADFCGACQQAIIKMIKFYSE